MKTVNNYVFFCGNLIETEILNTTLQAHNQPPFKNSYTA